MAAIILNRDNETDQKEVDDKSYLTTLPRCDNHACSLISKTVHVAMLLVTMLEKLAELTERFGAFWTLVRQSWYGVLRVAAAIRELRHITKVTSHASLLSGKLIDLVSRIVLSMTAATVATFYVLNGVGSRTKAALSADRTSHITRPMDLLVHMKLVL